MSAMMMVCIQIMSSDVAVQMGGAEGNFELNAFRPILINNYLHSALIMADMCDHFREFMIEGAQLNKPQLQANIEKSVMMVTALSPIIGYDKASVIAHFAIDNNLTLKQAALKNGVTEEADRFGEALFDVHSSGAASADGFGGSAPELASGTTYPPCSSPTTRSAPQKTSADAAPDE